MSIPDPRPAQKPAPQTDPKPLRVPLFDLTDLKPKKEEKPQ
jgi:hypothetical protein